MPSSLMHYSERYLADAADLRALLTAPVLVWSSNPGAPGSDEGWLSTRSNTFRGLPGPGDLLVFELKKSPERSNPFARGITVGRTVNNDVVLPHSSVSRFHAYFHEDLVTHAWSVVDAESKNGTFLAGARLEPSKPVRLAAETPLCFGEMEVQFLLPEAFLSLLARLNQR